ncbi:MAG: DUF4249 domain-containing protein [Bacteroidota bacterium]
MKKVNRIIYSLLVLALFSCEKEIQYEGEGKDPVLVLNGIQENDSTFKIYLERSFFFLSSEGKDDKYIETGATVTLTNLTTGQVFTMNASTIDNVYEFPFTTSPNQKFKIEVSHPDYETISSEMTTIPKVSLLDVDTSSFSVDGGSKRKKAILNWNDPVGENFYLVQVFSYDSLYNYTNTQYFACADPVFEDGESNTGINNGNNEYEEIYFNDVLFEGQQKKLEIDFPDYYAQDTTQNSVKYTYNLICMDKATYQYFISVRKSANSGFFTEPVKVYSNITNGFGVFSSKNTSKITK